MTLAAACFVVEQKGDSLTTLLFFHRQFIFVVAFTTFLISCVDYDILFANKALNHSQHPTEPIKVTLPDAFLPPNVCSAR